MHEEYFKENLLYNISLKLVELIKSFLLIDIKGESILFSFSYLKHILHVLLILYVI